MRDEYRSPVVAHQRFEAVRGEFGPLTLAQRFARIERINLWGADASVSGLGSEWAATGAIRTALGGLLERLAIRSMLDAPCGDANWIRGVVEGINYTGIDIVPSIIAGNIARFGCTGRRRFVVADITADLLPRADLIVCRDCLVHLSFANGAAAIANFRASGAEWLLTTSFPLFRVNRDCADGA